MPANKLTKHHTKHHSSRAVQYRSCNQTWKNLISLYSKHTV